MNFGSSLKAVALSGVLLTGSESLANDNDNTQIIQTMNQGLVIDTIEENTGVLTIGPSARAHRIDTNSGVINIGGPSIPSSNSDVQSGISIGENNGTITIDNGNGEKTVIKGNGEEYKN